jgi:Meckel syndrome type 1 protein
MDDALTLALEAGKAKDDTAPDGKTAAETGAQTGVPADAQALAALLAAPAVKIEAAQPTTDQAPATGAAGPVVAEAKIPPGMEHGLGLKVGLERRFGADETPTETTATDAAETKPANTESPGKARLIELAQALAAGRGAGASAKPAEAGQPKPYTPPAPVADQAAAAAAAQVDAAAKDAAQAPATEAAVAASAAQPAGPVPVFKDRVAPHTGRTEPGRKDGELASNALGASPADGAAKPAAVVSSFTAKPAGDQPSADPAAEAKVEAAPAKAEAPDDAVPTQAQAAPAHAAPAAAHAATAAVRGAPETVASLAAQMIKKLDGNRSTRFDIQLHPAELGRVDVRLEIGASGQLSASMSFDNPQAAAELKNRSAELRTALENAGFDLSGGLSFDVAGDRGQNQGQSQAQQHNPDGGGAQRGRAFEAALATAGESAGAALAGALNAYQVRAAHGLDIRI